jgi:hypothetical protein
MCQKLKLRSQKLPCLLFVPKEKKRKEKKRKEKKAPLP